VSRLTKAAVFFGLGVGVALPPAVYSSLTMVSCGRIAPLRFGAVASSAAALSRY